MSEVWSAESDREEFEELQSTVADLKRQLHGRVTAVYCQNPIAIVIDQNAFQSPKNFRDLGKFFPSCAIIIKRPGSEITFIDSEKHCGVMGEALELYDKNLVTAEHLDTLFGSGSIESASGANSDSRQTPEA